MAKVNFLYGTDVNYNGLSTKDTNTVYLITDTKKIYKGDTLIAGCYKGEIDEEELSDSSLKMTGTFTIMNGYCFMSVSVNIKQNIGYIRYNLPVQPIANNQKIINIDQGLQYACFCQTQQVNNNYILEIKSFVNNVIVTNNTNSINFTFIYPVADNAIQTLEQAAVSS